mmetsp:Transcript_87744/g.131581  ORF Transcript_87744/g.131581 Transcript_87744/m.131581 type:complete len:94 (-) Transcript_87744:261-542(-)
MAGMSLSSKEDNPKRNAVSSATSTPESLPAGRRVRLQGLKSQPELNGRLATVILAAAPNSSGEQRVGVAIGHGSGRKELGSSWSSWRSCRRST